MDMSDVLHDWVRVLNWEPEHDNSRSMRAFDDLVANGPIDKVCIERMDDGTFWMAIYKGEDSQRFCFHTKRGALVIARTELD
jgi:hypothetical protein